MCLWVRMSYWVRGNALCVSLINFKMCSDHVIQKVYKHTKCHLIEGGQVSSIANRISCSLSPLCDRTGAMYRLNCSYVIMFYGGFHNKINSVKCKLDGLFYFPKTYLWTRLQYIFMLAESFENFCTRHSSLSNQWTSGSLLLIYLLIYIVIYPPLHRVTVSKVAANDGEGQARN